MSGAWWSQPFAEEGSAAADGILRQLGRPGLDELTVLVREAAQNSWDARAKGVVDFSVSLSQFGPRAAEWSAAFGSGIAPESVDGFEAALHAGSYLLRISDRGTVGLRGPVRASVPPAPGEGNDFVQFLRNVGEPRDSALGGGTYGFGKGIFYRVSRVNSILVDTRTAVEGRLQRRIMGASLGQRFDRDGVRFTGRHWWGAMAQDLIPDPLIGDDADAAGEVLGLRGFTGDETGTDVYVLGADFGSVVLKEENEPSERTAKEAARFIASAITWNLWPKMVGESAGMRFSIDLEGESVSIPDPAVDVQLRPFVLALGQLRSGGGQPYKRAGFGEIGRLAVENSVISTGAKESTDVSARAFQGASHHIARMRDAELVVDYMEGPAPVDSAIQYGGVFRASQRADENFAAAEPPTHDTWVEQGLSPAALSMVRGARHWIRGRLRIEFEQASLGGNAIGGLGGLSNRLASLAPRLEAGGAGLAAGPGGRGGGTGGGGRSASVKVGAPRIQDRASTRVIVADVSIKGIDRQRRLTCTPAVVVDGGRESNAPVGLSAPRVLGWETTDGRVLSIENSIDVDSSTPDTIVLIVELLPDLVTRIEVKESGLHA